MKCKLSTCNKKAVKVYCSHECSIKYWAHEARGYCKVRVSACRKCGKEFSQKLYQSAPFSNCENCRRIYKKVEKVSDLEAFERDLMLD